MNIKLENAVVYGDLISYRSNVGTVVNTFHESLWLLKRQNFQVPVVLQMGEAVLKTDTSLFSRSVKKNRKMLN